VAEEEVELVKRAPSVIMVLVFLVMGGYLLWRALQGGGPLFFFLAAVSFGMAIAAMQGINRGRQG